MSATAEGTAAKRGFYWISPREGPLYDCDLMSEFSESDPLHADILKNSILAKSNATEAGCHVGAMIGAVSCWLLKNPLTKTLPTGYSLGQLLVRTMPAFSVCMIACTALGARTGDSWGKIPDEAEAKFHDWLQNRASAADQSSFQQ